MQICGLLLMPSVRRRNVMMALGLLIFVRVAVTAKMREVRFCTKLYMLVVPRNAQDMYQGTPQSPKKPAEQEKIKGIQG